MDEWGNEIVYFFDGGKGVFGAITATGKPVQMEGNEYWPTIISRKDFRKLLKKNKTTILIDGKSWPATRCLKSWTIENFTISHMSGRLYIYNDGFLKFVTKDRTISAQNIEELKLTPPASP